MTSTSGVEVTLSASLFRKLVGEARSLGLPIEWLIASMVVDTVEPAEEAISEPIAA